MRSILVCSILFIISAHGFQTQSATRKLSLIDTFCLGSKCTARTNQHTKGLSMTSAGDDPSGSTSVVTNVLNIFGASTSILVSGTFFIVLALQRDALMVSFFIGAITNGALSKILKKILNQDRPDAPAASVEKPSDKGMPSSHAMSLGFIGTFTMLTLEWTQPIIPIYVAIALYYRVQTRLHTIEQVAVGMAFGVSNGLIWRYLVDGRNPMGINVMDFVTNRFLNDQGLLPIQLLIVPAIAGAVVVGSLERKISKFVKEKSK